jgi:ABC-2 type transport system ATP-binding protein
VTKNNKHVIEVKNLVKSYNKANEKAVDDVSFYVEEGTFFSLLGPNGAGKTTIISILTTLLSATTGSAIVVDNSVDTEAEKVRKNIGVIFQNPSLDQNLTAEENIRFHANLYNLYPYRPAFSLMSKHYQKRVQELSRILGLEKDIFKPVKSLSGGMKRKLEIIRSLMHKPKVLFLDEPTTGLDPVSRQNLWNYLKKIREEEDVTIFLTTHYLEEAEGSDYICIINNGKIVAQGSPRKIKNALIENFVLVDTKNRQSLEKELSENKFEFEGKGPFRITINGNSTQQIIKKINTKLTVLEIHTPTLEDAYVKIVENSNE